MTCATPRPDLRGLESAVTEVSSVAPPGDAAAITFAPTEGPLPPPPDPLRSDVPTSPPSGGLDSAGSQAVMPPGKEASRSSRRPPEVRGEKTIGMYEVLETLGHGGMGTVYKAWHPLHRAFFALKVIKGDRAQLERFSRLREAFHRESHILLTLAPHENVVRCVHADEASCDGEPALYIAMEYLEGESLEARLARGPLGLREALRIARAVASALEAVHGHDPLILHRDVKPGNIFLSRDGGVKLIDFGLAAVEDWRLSRMSIYAAGSKPWMAPEQFDGLQFCTERSDLYSLGVALFQMVAGRCPFAADTEQGFRTAHQETSPPGILEANPRVERGPLLDAVQNIVTKLLAKRPVERFQSAHDLVAAIEHASGGGAISSPRITRPESVRARRKVAIVAAVVLVVALAVSSGVWFARSDDAAKVERARAMMDEGSLDGAEAVVTDVLARDKGFRPALDLSDELGLLRTKRRDVEALRRRSEDEQRSGDLRSALDTLEQALAASSAALSRPELDALRDERDRVESARRASLDAALSTATASLGAKDTGAAERSLDRVRALVLTDVEKRLAAGLASWRELVLVEEDLDRRQIDPAAERFAKLDPGELPKEAERLLTNLSAQIAAAKALERAIEGGPGGDGLPPAIEGAERSGLARRPAFHERVEWASHLVFTGAVGRIAGLRPREDAGKMAIEAALALRFLPAAERASFRAAATGATRTATSTWVEARLAIRASLSSPLAQDAWDAYDEAHAQLGARPYEVLVFVRKGYRVKLDGAWVEVLPFYIGAAELSPNEALNRLREGTTLPAQFACFTRGDFTPIGKLSFEAASSLASHLDARLPTRDEWRVAASVEPERREGPHRNFSWGPTSRPDLASARRKVNEPTDDVSPWGCVNMSSNVREWVREGMLAGGSYELADCGEAPFRVETSFTRPRAIGEDSGVRLVRDVPLPPLDGLVR